MGFCQEAHATTSVCIGRHGYDLETVFVVPSEAPGPANTRTCLCWSNRAKKKKNATRAANTFEDISKYSLNSKKSANIAGFYLWHPTVLLLLIISWSHSWAPINVCIKWRERRGYGCLDLFVQPRPWVQTIWLSIKMTWLKERKMTRWHNSFQSQKGGWRRKCQILAFYRLASRNRQCWLHKDQKWPPPTNQRLSH